MVIRKAKFTELHFLAKFEVMPSGFNPQVYFFEDGVKLTIRNKKKLKQFIADVFKNENKKPESINYIFSTDEKVLKINQRYLNHNYLTDIITFDLSQTRQSIVADVYISSERVKENALKFGIKFNRELHRVIIHGALHLCGYADKTKKQKDDMRNREDYYLSKYFT